MGNVIDRINQFAKQRDQQLIDDIKEENRQKALQRYNQMQQGPQVDASASQMPNQPSMQLNRAPASEEPIINEDTGVGTPLSQDHAATARALGLDTNRLMQVTPEERGRLLDKITALKAIQSGRSMGSNDNQ